MLLSVSKGVPGPGKYDITRTFDVIPPSQPELMPIEQPPFLTQAKVSLKQLILIYLFIIIQTKVIKRPVTLLSM